MVSAAGGASVTTPHSCRCWAKHALGGTLTMGAGHWLMEMSTESPGRSSWRLRPSNEQNAEERLSSGTWHSGGEVEAQRGGVWQ